MFKDLVLGKLNNCDVHTHVRSDLHHSYPECLPIFLVLYICIFIPFLAKPGSWPQNTAASVLSKKWSLQTEPQALFTHIWIVPCLDSSSELSEKSVNLTSPVVQSANSVDGSVKK